MQHALVLREADWVETEAMLSLAISLGQPAAASATAHLAAQQAQHVQPPTAQEVNLSLLLHAQRAATYVGGGGIKRVG